MPRCFPDLPTVQDAFKRGRRTLVPLARRLFGDALTPPLAYRRLVREDDRLAPSFLLESVVGGDRVGRFSFLGVRPVEEVVAYGHQVTVRDHRAGTTQAFRHDDPLTVMRQRSADADLLPVRDLPAFTGGWVGYAGYDTIRYVEAEKLTAPPPDDRHLPDLHFQRYRDVVAFDHARKTVLIITHLDTADGDDAEAAYEAGIAKLNEIEARLLDASDDKLVTPAAHLDLAAAPPPLPTSNLGEGGYQRAVEACKQYIAAGDAFQIVPSQRFTLHTAVDPFDVYRALRVINPSPYMFYLQAEGCLLIGSSPEILVRVEGGVAASRPLAGTRKRGATDAEDEALALELQRDPKDLAEHVMLVDLHRNDIGRVAVPGTITLPELLVVERYSHVMHLSSEVRGTLREGLDAWDALRFALPVGTVSGAPKVRAMQIIDEVEPSRRGPYGGAVGYADLAGNLDMAIALRTMVVLPPSDATGQRWRIDIQAGAGIVADSVPDLEHIETVNKAAALAQAVAVAERLFG